jgi:hypothetical protein
MANRGDKPLKDKMQDELRFKSGSLSFVRVFEKKDAALRAASDERQQVARDRQMSRCSYMYTHRVVVKPCNEYGEFPGMPCTDTLQGGRRLANIIETRY